MKVNRLLFIILTLFFLLQPILSYQIDQEYTKRCTKKGITISTYSLSEKQRLEKKANATNHFKEPVQKFLDLLAKGELGQGTGTLLKAAVLLPINLASLIGIAITLITALVFLMLLLMVNTCCKQRFKTSSGKELHKKFMVRVDEENMDSINFLEERQTEYYDGRLKALEQRKQAKNNVDVEEEDTLIEEINKLRDRSLQTIQKMKEKTGVFMRLQRAKGRAKCTATITILLSLMLLILTGYWAYSLAATLSSTEEISCSLLFLREQVLSGLPAKISNFIGLGNIEPLRKAYNNLLSPNITPSLTNESTKYKQIGLTQYSYFVGIDILALSSTLDTYYGLDGSSVLSPRISEGKASVNSNKSLSMEITSMYMYGSKLNSFFESIIQEKDEAKIEQYRVEVNDSLTKQEAILNSLIGDPVLTLMDRIVVANNSSMSVFSTIGIVLVVCGTLLIFILSILTICLGGLMNLYYKVNKQAIVKATAKKTKSIRSSTIDVQEEMKNRLAMMVIQDMEMNGQNEMSALKPIDGLGDINNEFDEIDLPPISKLVDDRKFQYFHASERHELMGEGGDGITPSDQDIIDHLEIPLELEQTSKHKIGDYLTLGRENYTVAFPKIQTEVALRQAVPKGILKHSTKINKISQEKKENHPSRMLGMTMRELRVEETATPLRIKNTNNCSICTGYCLLFAALLMFIYTIIVQTIGLGLGAGCTLVDNILTDPKYFPQTLNQYAQFSPQSEQLVNNCITSGGSKKLKSEISEVAAKVIGYLDGFSLHKTLQTIWTKTPEPIYAKSFLKNATDIVAMTSKDSDGTTDQDIDTGIRHMNSFKCMRDFYAYNGQCGSFAASQSTTGSLDNLNQDFCWQLPNLGDSTQKRYSSQSGSVCSGASNVDAQNMLDNLRSAVQDYETISKDYFSLVEQLYVTEAGLINTATSNDFITMMNTVQNHPQVSPLIKIQATHTSGLDSLNSCGFLRRGVILIENVVCFHTLNEFVTQAALSLTLAIFIYLIAVLVLLGAYFIAKIRELVKRVAV